MPQRSNDFQQLVRSIYEQITPAGASVTESAMLRERGSSVEREVDVLIETRVGDTDVRLAVECRDRSRRDDIEWIDQLIGKYRDLPVDKVIAVSAAGVTKAADEKAAANRIEIRTLREALDADWPKELRRSSFANLNINVRPIRYFVVTDPEWPSPVPPNSIMFGSRVLTKPEFEEMLTAIGHDEIARILSQKTEHPLRKLENLNRDYEMEFELGVREPVIFTSNLGTQHRLLRMVLTCEVKFRYEDIPVRRHLLGNIGVTVAAASATNEPIRVLSVQIPDKQSG